MNESQFNKYISKIDTTFFKDLCLEKGTLKFYNKGDYISREGDIFPYWGYIESGIIKYTCYNATEKKEYNTGFSFEGEFVADYPTCLYNLESEISICALTDCKILICHSNDAVYIARIAAEQLFFQTYSRYADFYRLTPEERYKQLLKRSPYLFQLIPLKEIASYLKITPTHMSRIRKAITMSK